METVPSGIQQTVEIMKTKNLGARRATHHGTISTMIHMELGPSTIVGVGLSLIGFILYLVKTKKPDVSRDYDLFFSSVGLLCGGILIFQGWRLDPILLLCQILSSATAIFFIGESLWLRGTKSKNIKPFAGGPSGRSSKNRLIKKNAFASTFDDDAPYGKQRCLHEGSPDTHQDFFDKKVFFSDYSQVRQRQISKEKTFIPVETQRAKDITEMSQQFGPGPKAKRVYEEKKLSIYYQLINKYFDFGYTDPIDYCQAVAPYTQADLTALRRRV